MIRDKVLLLIKISKKNNLNISVAESCTGGLLSSSIIEIPGASDIFNSGFITYSNIAKIKHLGVNKDIVKKFGAVSNETSLAMAKGLYKISKSNLVVSITGVAGPAGGTLKNPVGTVYFTFGVRQNKKTISYSTFRHYFKSKNRVGIQKKSVNYVLDKFIEIAKTYKLD